MIVSPPLLFSVGVSVGIAYSFSTWVRLDAGKTATKPPARISISAAKLDLAVAHMEVVHLIIPCARPNKKASKPLSRLNNMDAL
jgi:hypothetical protein